MTAGGTTDRVRAELAAGPVGDAEVVPELAALLRAAGHVVLASSGTRLELFTPTGATARRSRQLLRVLGADPTVLVREATNVRSRVWGVVLEGASAASVGRHLGLLDDGDRPTATAPAAHGAQPAAVVRGAFLASGSVSAAQRSPHLEVRTSSRAWCEQLAEAAGQLTTGIAVGALPSGARVVCKDGAAIATLLEAIGAPVAAAAHREHRRRRNLRAEAQRLANADAANVRRAVDAAGDQVALVERAIALAGWDALGEDLREVALARLANPAASLAEVGQLCDPPIGKSAVHRRLARLRALAEEPGAGATG